jgi:tetratricopeptide (TPR) repeat protein
MIHKGLKLQEGNINEALYLSRLSQPANTPAFRIKTASYFVNRGQLDCAELTVDMAIKEIVKTQKWDLELLVQALVNKAAIAKRRKDFDKAEGYLRKAYRFALKASSQVGKGLVFKGQGDIALAQNDYSIAKNRYERAVKLLMSDKPDLGERASYLCALSAYIDFDFKKSLDMYLIASRSTNALLQLQAHQGVIDALAALNRYEDTIAACRSLDSKLSSRFDVPHTVRQNTRMMLHKKQAGIYLTQGKTGRAAELYILAAKEATILERAKVLATLAVTEFVRGKPQKAEQYEKETRALLTGKDRDVPEVLRSFSELSLMRGSADVASQQLFGATLELPKIDANQLTLLPYDLLSISIMQSKAELSRAKEKADELYAFTKEKSPNTASHASVLSHLASIAQLNGHIEEAQEMYAETVSIGEDLACPSVILRGLSGLGSTALEQWQPQLALEHFGRALTIAKDTQQAITAHNLMIRQSVAEIRLREKASESDIEVLSNLLEDGYRYDSLPLDLHCMLQIASLCFELGDLNRAISYFDEAGKVSEENGLTLFELLAKGFVGMVLQDMGDTARAEDLLSYVLSRMSALGIEITARREFEERYRDITGFWL